MLRIAIPAPTSADHAYNQRCVPSYEEAVRAQGAEPIPIPLSLTEPELKALADTCQAILLPGSPADVDPARYGQQSGEHTSAADPAREWTDLFLLDHAYQTHKPILGVCFGCQILNVYRGGTLLQDLATFPVNHPSAAGVSIAHSASVAPESVLGDVSDRLEAPETHGFMKLPVNSSHHQAIGVVGQGLHVSARCPQDNVVEAIESPDPKMHFVIGVQWHPERSTALSATSRALFARLVYEAGKWATAR